MDWHNPDYTSVFKKRQLHIDEVRSNPILLDAMKRHYKDNPWDFINDWGMTFDPRQIEKGMLASVPFILWPRQEEFLHWLDGRWKAGEYGLTEKSRDCGVTWLSVGYCCTQWLFNPGFSAGFGSAKESKVDKKGDPDCIFEKIRFFINNIPEEFMPEGFNERLHSGFMKLINPENGATITGDSGLQIGRGGRKSIWIVDESAFVENQQAAANAISMATNCHIDVSTFNGNGNLFYRKSVKFEGTDHKFIFDWRQDPRKDDIWYAKQKAEKDAVTVAQEIDRDPNASATDAFIPAHYVRAAIDLHLLIKVKPSGVRATGFDPADEGDAKATVSKYGYLLTAAEMMKDGDITQAIPWAYEQAFANHSQVLSYDADGMGAPVMKLTLEAHAAGNMPILPFYGSGEVVDKDKHLIGAKGLPDKSLKTNGDAYLNYRAQTATWLRNRFKASYDVRMQIESGGVAVGVDVEEIISIDSTCLHAFELIAELSRPKRIYTNNGKIKVESKKEMKARGVESPNLFDACIMVNAVKAPSRTALRRTPTRSNRPGINA
ncbi:MAG: TerL protein [Blastopirellula sp.]|nr:MAG: TerL protein [Blastopirellula sp.]